MTRKKLLAAGALGMFFWVSSRHVAKSFERAFDDAIERAFGRIGSF
jgi:hypothetical protein